MSLWPMTKLTLYTRPDCCLCDDAKAMIDRAQREFSFELDEVDISSDPELVDRYGERIPVVMLNGAPVFELRVDEHELRRKIAQTAESVA
jgi:glutaredoxin